MNDLIKREELYHDMTMKSLELHEKDLSWSEFIRGFSFAMEFVKNLPSVEPEQKKGEWSFIGDNMFKCTCCGVLYTTHQLNGLRNYDTDPYVPYYCPHCGAKMRSK